MRRRHLLPLALLVCAAPALAQSTVFVTNTNDTGPGSLREAIDAANSTPGAQLVAFHIPTSDPNYFAGVFNIFVEGFSSYTLTDDGTTIDGTTQTAFTGDTDPSGPEIAVLTDPRFTSLSGFVVDSDDNVIRGIAGFSFFRYGVEFNGDNNRVEGCRIGDPRGAFFGMPTSAGVYVTGSANVIGGTAPGAGNSVSSGGIGVWLRFSTATGNVVQGNALVTNYSSGVATEDGSGNVIGGTAPGARNYIYGNGHASSQSFPIGEQVDVGGSNNVVEGNWIGIDEAGAAMPGAARHGVVVSGSDNRIGGAVPGAGNVIGGHTFRHSTARAAVLVEGGSGHAVEGNLLGTDPTGTLPRPNALGVLVSASNNRVGGTSPGSGNTIAFNELDGVIVGTAVVGAAVLGNALFQNGGLGIDLGDDGLTANDLHDPDGGANRLQNGPVVASAALSGATLTVTYRVDTAPANAAYPLRVEFFRADADAEEGAALLGVDTYTAADYAAGQPGPKTAAIDVSGTGLGVGDFVVATASDGAGNTSEFGAAAAVVGEGAAVVVSATPVNPPVVIGPGGGSFAFTVTLTNTTDQPQTFQAWSAVTGPLDRDPVVPPRTLTLPAGATVTRTLTQAVPGNAPAGTYAYAVNVGDFPGVVSASASFPVVKEGGALASAGAPSPADAWSVSGWDEATESAVAGPPGGFALSEASPNPSSGRARLTLEVAEAQAVRVEVLDALGRRVALLHDGVLAVGGYAFTFDASSLPAGVYVIRAEGETFAATRRATLVR